MKDNIFYLFSFVFYSRIGSAELTASLNPGCNTCNNNNQSIIEIIQRNNISSTHFIISACQFPFTIPSGIVAQSSANSSTSYNWTKILNGTNVQNSIKLVNSTFYGFAFPYLHPYRDERDTANISEASEVTTWDLSKCFWNLAESWDTVPNNETGFLNVAFKCDDTRRNFFNRKGYIELVFTVSEWNQRHSRAPHLLLFGGLSIQVRVILSNLVSPWLRATRYALPLTIIAKHILLPNENFPTHTVTNVDDEMSPGVFNEETVYLGGNPGDKVLSNQSAPPAFLQWKSVSYVSESAAELKYSRPIAVSGQKADVTLQDLSSSLVYAVFSGSEKKVEPTDLAIRSVNISFGEPGDGFFVNTRYLDWSFTMSTGDPSASSDYSALITGLIVLFASVMFITLSGLVFMAGRRCFFWRQQLSEFRHSPLINAISEEVMNV